ncbi:hypothetical protein EDD18DRAFT_1110417 [Armillaria luteobubalina]|uniref:Uncharacterized protein n=1 Tax=Armillaria luteobubalina TaxID=153913 RepID=A0AA39TGX2_9AGAR|nr:hypothetical protein EDD18DRAFT_1110417 [Armillaria luteobubalina]
MKLGCDGGFYASTTGQPPKKKNKGNMGMPSMTASLSQVKLMDQEFTVALIKDTAAIQTTIEQAFTGLNPPLSSYNRRKILMPLGSGQGGMTHLIPMRLRVPGLISSGDLALACTKNAKPHGYKKNMTFPNLLWITLQSGSPNILFKWKLPHAKTAHTKAGSEDEYSDSEDSHINGPNCENVQDAQEMDPSANASSKAGKLNNQKASTGSVKEEPEQGYSHQTVKLILSLDDSSLKKSDEDSGRKPQSMNAEPLFSVKTDNGHSDAQNLPPSDYYTVLHLLHYVQTPDNFQLWWVEKPHPLFSHFETSMMVLEGVLRAFKTNPATFSSQQIIVFLAESINKPPLSDFQLDAVSSPWTLSDESEYDASFIISPGTLGIVLSYIQVQFDLTSTFHDSSNPRIMYADVVVGGWMTQKYKVIERKLQELKVVQYRRNKVPERDPSIITRLENGGFRQMKTQIPTVQMVNGIATSRKINQISNCDGNCTIQKFLIRNLAIELKRDLAQKRAD